jgi:DNA-binding beta-propeller fold protein YncE
MLTTVAAGRVFDYSYCIGMYGMSGQGFWSPQDFALAGDTMYVLSRGAEELGQRVSRVTLDHRFLGQFGAFGRGDGQFVWPRSIALDGDGNVYASDDFLNRVSVFDPEGAFLSCWGESGDDKGQLNGPCGIAFDGDGNVLIVDSMNNRVQRFTSDGKFLGKFGHQGDGEGEFNLPWGICRDDAGSVYVADWKNNRVQKFDADGNFMLSFEASPTSGVGDLHGPTGVAVDSEGDVYVTDWGNHRLQVYAPDGRFIATLVGDAQQPSPWTQTYIDANPDIIKARRRVDLEPEWRFRRPVSVRVDENDRIFVLEANRHRVQVYDKVKDYEEHPLNL